MKTRKRINQESNEEQKYMRRRKRPGWEWSAMPVLAGLMMCGCASDLKLPKPQVGAVTSYKYSRSADGVKIAIDPITDPDEVVRIFGMDLLKKDVLPVLVVVTNQHSSLSYLVSPELFTLLNGQHESGRTTKGASTGGAEAAGWTVALLGIGPTLLALPFISTEADRALVINQNLRLQQLLQKSLSPGASTSGFIYFAIPKDRQRERAWTLVYKCRALQNGKEKEMRLTFDW